MPVDSPGAVLHYVGYDVDRGGILAVIRALAAENQFPCVLGVNPNFQPERSRGIPLLRLPAMAGDTISVATMLRARSVARQVRSWLAADSARVFHGHSRAGLLVALWLKRMGEKRVAATVHCYGRRRWFYRWAAGQLRGQGKLRHAIGVCCFRRKFGVNYTGLVVVGDWPLERERHRRAFHRLGRITVNR